MAKTIPDPSQENLVRTEGSPDLGVTPGLAHAQRLSELAGQKMRMNGCSASSHAALFADVDVVTVYPIRPYTAIMMNIAQFIADGLLDAEYIHADGEHSQLSSARRGLGRSARVHGFLRCGRDVRLRDVLTHLGGPGPRADGHRRSHARPAG